MLILIFIVISLFNCSKAIPLYWGNLHQYKLYSSSSIGGRTKSNNSCHLRLIEVCFKDLGYFNLSPVSLSMFTVAEWRLKICWTSTVA